MILDDTYFMGLALKEAQRGDRAGEVPVGAVLVAGSQIITRTHNQTQLLNDATAHAEMLCLSAGFVHFNAKYLPDCTLYVTLEPCPMCAAALCWAQIGRVVAGAADPKSGFARFSPCLLHKRTHYTQGVMAQQSIALLKDFFVRKRKIK